jgi:hypothetical protein
MTAYAAASMDVSDIYDHGTVTSIVDLEVEVPVYTLIVEDPEHQYVAAGFIAKNSSAAGLMNLALLEIHDKIPLHKWGPGTGVINQCHDSIVVECPENEAEAVAKILEDAMNQTHASLPGVTFTATAAIGKTWKEVG